MKLLNEGRHHLVYEYDSQWVLKLPKSGNPIKQPENAQKSVDFFDRHFPDFVPEHTYIEICKGLPYAIVQTRIQNTMHLGEYLIQTNEPSLKVLDLLEEFLERCMNILMETGIGFDIIGTPPEEKLAHILIGCTNLLVSKSITNNSGDIRLVFVDNVVGTKSIQFQSMILNRIAFLIIPSRKKRLIQLNNYLNSIQEYKKLQFSRTL